jgi:hypothetical protein
MFEGMSRRSFVKALAASAMSSSTINSALAQERVAASGEPTEWSYTSGKQYSDPFNQVDVDAIITLPSGQQERAPAFWAGGSTWRVRYSHIPARTPITNAAQSKSQKMAATFSMLTALRSFGSAIPGGWGCASGLAGRTAFRR